MVKRYRSNSAFATTVGKNKFATVFSPDRVDRDGVVGYSADEVKGLPKKLVDEMFTIITVDDAAGPVETASAVPGTKRTTKPKAKAK